MITQTREGNYIHVSVCWGTWVGQSARPLQFQIVVDLKFQVEVDLKFQIDKFQVGKFQFEVDLKFLKLEMYFATQSLHEVYQRNAATELGHWTQEGPVMQFKFKGPNRQLS